MIRPSACRVVLAVGLGLALPPAADAADGGFLTQLPAPGDCISRNGVNGCVAGREIDEVRSIAVSPDGRSLYAAASDSDAVTIFDRDPSTGALTQKAGPAGCISETGSGLTCGDGDALVGADAVAVSPDSQQVYVGSANGIAIFSRDTTSGALTQPAGGLGCVTEDGSGGACADGVALTRVKGIALSPTGSQLYATSQDQGAVAIFDRGGDGGLTQRPGTGACMGPHGTCTDAVIGAAEAVAVSPDGESVYAASDSYVANLDRDPSTGDLSQPADATGCVSSVSGTGCTEGSQVERLHSVTVSPDNHHVYATSSSSFMDASNVTGAVVVLTRAASGALTQHSCVGHSGCTSARGLVGASSVVVSPDGANVYAASEGPATGGVGSLSVFDRDAATGALTQKPDTGGCLNFNGSSGCAPLTGLQYSHYVTMSADGANVYSSGAVDALGAFKRGDGTVTPIPTPIPPPVPSPGPGPGPGPPPDGGAGTLKLGRVSTSAKKGTLTLAVSAPGPGRVSAVAKATKKRRKPLKDKSFVAARVRKTVTGAGSVTLVLEPRKEARAILRRDGRLKAKLTVTFTPASGKATVEKVTATFKLKKKKSSNARAGIAF